MHEKNIQITSHLIGFHSFRKDHNYGNYKASLINDLQGILNVNFDNLKVAGMDILKNGNDEIFEIKLTPNSLIYQDSLNFEEMVSNSKQMLQAWLNYSPNVKLSLVGSVTNFQYILDKPTESNTFRLKNRFFNDFSIGKKIKGIDFSFNYIENHKGYDYNIILTLLEKIEKQYILLGTIDFHEKTDNMMSGISLEACDRIFSSGKEYFEEKLINILNI